MNDEIILTNLDDFDLAEIGPWARQKYSLLYEYMVLFSTGMKNRWNKRVYIDLFSGPGKGIVKGTNNIYKTSPLLALSVKDKFDKYIFCDISENNINVLKKRVEIEFPNSDVTYLIGDSNELASDIIEKLKHYKKSDRMLSFCFVDPFSMNIKFSTIRTIQEIFADFLVFLALGMDANRNKRLYLNKNHERISEFLDDPNWREDWENDSEHLFTKFLIDKFADKMTQLGYLDQPYDNFIPIKSFMKNLKLYYLAFFSKHERGYEFWEKVKKRNTNPTLFD